jgi:hypothetical protein
MFRESLSLTKERFLSYANDKANFKKMPHSSDVQALVRKLVSDTVHEYGDVGIFDPERLAEIDFIQQPEQVSGSVQSWVPMPSWPLLAHPLHVSSRHAAHRVGGRVEAPSEPRAEAGDAAAH